MASVYSSDSPTHVTVKLDRGGRRVLDAPGRRAVAPMEEERDEGTSSMSTASEAAKALPKAERALLEWSTGGRSNTNLIMQLDGGQTTPEQHYARTVAIEQADAASISAAIEKVRGLRLLVGIDA